MRLGSHTMRFARFARLIIAGLTAALLVAPMGEALAQQTSAASPDAAGMAPLTLRTRVALPGVYGRMDHYGWDSKRGQLILSALGNNTVELIDSWRQVH